MTKQIKIDDALLDKLSAYIDGELSADDMRSIEELAAQDPQIAQEIDALRGLDDKLKQSFDALLEIDTPIELPDSAPSVSVLPKAANSNIAPPVWMRIAAALALFVFGAGTGGYLAGALAPQEVVKTRGWMADIADYHRIYSGQKRHLVEVAANEQDHIESWLTKTVGITLKVPDLSARGFEFQGARLLVATGKPVAQFMYRDANGQIVAICGLKTNSGAKDGFSSRSFDDVEMVRWDRDGASFVVVGTQATDLKSVATLASTVL